MHHLKGSVNIIESEKKEKKNIDIQAAQTDHKTLFWIKMKEYITATLIT